MDSSKTEKALEDLQDAVVRLIEKVWDLLLANERIVIAVYFAMVLVALLLNWLGITK